MIFWTQFFPIVMVPQLIFNYKKKGHGSQPATRVQIKRRYQQLTCRRSFDYSLAITQAGKEGTQKPPIGGLILAEI
jgi:hypothetical protein